MFICIYIYIFFYIQIFICIFLSIYILLCIYFYFYFFIFLYIIRSLSQWPIVGLLILWHLQYRYAWIITIYLYKRFSAVLNKLLFSFTVQTALGDLAFEAVLFLFGRLYSFTVRTGTVFVLIKNIPRNRIDLNDHYHYLTLYIEFRQFLLRLDLIMLTQNFANVNRYTVHTEKYNF